MILPRMSLRGACAVAISKVRYTGDSHDQFANWSQNDKEVQPISPPKIRQGRGSRAVREKREIFPQRKPCVTQAYFVYGKARKRTYAEKEPLISTEIISRTCYNKKGAGRKYFAPHGLPFRIARLLFVVTHAQLTLKQTGPYVPWHGGGPEPCGRWK